MLTKHGDLTGPAVDFAGIRGSDGAMAGTIFINCRRDDSMGTAGRLHDRLARALGRENLFADFGHIPAGVDFEPHLNNWVAACQVFVPIIGPSWLDAKDKAGQRRLHHSRDFVAIEISAALARNIRVIPVLVDGARMPKASELPDSLKPLAQRQAIEVRQLHFDRDAEALVERVREALNEGSVGLRSWQGTSVAGVADGDREAVRIARAPPAPDPVTRVPEALNWGSVGLWSWRGTAAGVVAAAGLLLVGWIGLHWINTSVWPPWAETRVASNARAQAEAEAKRKSEEAEQLRQAALKAEQERQASAAAEAEARRKSQEAEQQRLAALREEDDRKRVEAEARARYAALVSQGNTDSSAGNYDRAIANFNEAIRLDPKSSLAFINRGDTYTNKGDHDRAIADYNEAIRLDPKSVLAFSARGVAYAKKGDYDRAIADFSRAIRLDSKSAHAFRNRGVVYATKGDNDRAIADFDRAIRLDPKSALALRARGVAYANKGDNDQAIADFNEAIRLDPKSSLAFRNRGESYTNKGDYDRAIADYNEAIRLDPNDAIAFCKRGRAKLNSNDVSGNADITKASQLDASVCQ
jgi:tetratricopeptide (TPR) repeat protein